MKKLLLLILTVLASTQIALAADVLLVTDDDSPASDVLKLTDLALHLEGEGYSTDSALNSEVDASDYDNQVVVFMFHGNAMIYGEGDSISIIEGFLLSSYDIESSTKAAHDEDDLRVGLVCEDCPRLVDDLIQEMENPLVIAPEADLQAANLLGLDAKSPKEVSAAGIVGKPLVILGGPCANPYWELFADETCSTWPGGKFIKKANNGDQTVILIAGTTREDTLNTARAIFDGGLVIMDEIEVR